MPVVCAAFATVLSLAPARADSVSTVQKDDEPETVRLPTHFECVFGPSLERLRRESAQPVKRLVRRCRLPHGVIARVSIFVDRAGAVRDPHVTDGLTGDDAACVETALKRWRYSRAAVAELNDIWEPAPVTLFIANPAP